MEIQFYYWFILALVFRVLDYFKIGRLSLAVAFAAALQGIMSYFQPELGWGWQLWGFGMLMVLASIFYLATQAKETPAVDDDRRLAESTAASYLIGTRVTLNQPLYPGSSKLEVKGRFWKVKANRDFPAGTVVEVVGNRGNTLEIVSAESTRYQETKTQSRDGLSMDAYHRDPAIEALYGDPDFESWALFREALQEHSKQSLVHAYHVISGLQGKTLEEARESLNTATLALYDARNEGLYEELKDNMYSEPDKYQFLYMNGRWPSLDRVAFEELINELIAALHTPWAARIRGKTSPDMAKLAVMMIRKQQVSDD
jgi:membrane protein implicated in regulation of membrane protease activity